MPNFFSNNSVISITAAILLAAAAGFGVWTIGGSDKKLSDLPAASEMAVSSSSEQLAISSTSSAGTSSESQPPEYEKQFSTQKSERGPNQFASKEYNFTFQYPENFSVSAFDDRGGHVVLVQQAEGETAVEIFITDWDEPASAVTPDRIKQDLPDLTIRNPKKMRMAGEGSALTFVGKSKKFGTTREVWFARRGHLYQIITPAGGQDFLASLLETWNFR